MLTVRADQMQALDEHIEANFAHRLADSLRAFFPFRLRGADPAVVEKFALACVKQAKALGLRSEAGITRYANLSTVIGIGFEAKPLNGRIDLAPRDDENRDPAWLDRIVPLVEQTLRESGGS
jgi:hypothetical protein